MRGGRQRAASGEKGQFLPAGQAFDARFLPLGFGLSGAGQGCQQAHGAPRAGIFRPAGACAVVLGQPSDHVAGHAAIIGAVGAFQQIGQPAGRSAGGGVFGVQRASHAVSSQQAVQLQPRMSHGLMTLPLSRWLTVKNIPRAAPMT